MAVKLALALKNQGHSKFSKGETLGYKDMKEKNKIKLRDMMGFELKENKSNASIETQS